MNLKNLIYNSHHTIRILKYSNGILSYSNYIRQIIEQLKYSNIRIPKNSTNSPFVSTLFSISQSFPFSNTRSRPLSTKWLTITQPVPSNSSILRVTWNSGEDVRDCAHGPTRLDSIRLNATRPYATPVKLTRPPLDSTRRRPTQLATPLDATRISGLAREPLPHLVIS